MKTVYDIGSIRIDGVEYEIVKAEDGAGAAYHAGYVGQVDFRNNVIKLLDTSLATSLQTLMHEAMHVIDYNSFMDNHLSHAILNRISISMTQILLDNPELCKLMLEASRKETP